MNSLHKKNLQKFAKAGLAFAENGDQEKAIDCFRKAIAIEPEQPTIVLVNLAKALFAQGSYEEAAIIFNDLKSKHPDLPAGYVGLARIARKQKAWKRCLEMWETCFRLFPEQAQPLWYIHQAESLLELGKTEKAGEIYKACTKSYPDNLSGFIGMAKTAQNSKQWKEALVYWQICFDRFPSKVKPWWHKQKQMILLELGHVEDVQREALARHETQHGKSYDDILRQKLEKSQSDSLNYQHILIITYGRSGSTLLQGILNSIDGVLLRGENENIFFDFYKAYQKLIDLKNNRKNAVLPHQAWYGISFFDEAILMAHFQELAKGILLADQYEKATKLTFGFKEIRYDAVGDDLEAYLVFLTKLFPNAAFIFNTRNLGDVSKSAWWKEKNRNSVINKLSLLEERFEAYAREHDDCFLIRYEDVVTKGEKLKEMFNVLGATYQPEKIDTILNIPHSYKPEQEHIKKLFKAF